MSGQRAMSDNPSQLYPRFHLLVSFSSWALSMFEEKRGGRRRLSMTRCVVAYLVVVVGRGIKFPMGWPDAFTVWSLAFAVGIAKALDSAPADKVVDAVTGMFGKGMESVGGWMSQRTAAWGSSAVDDPTVPMGRAEVEE